MNLKFLAEFVQEELELKGRTTFRLEANGSLRALGSSGLIPDTKGFSRFNCSLTLVRNLLSLQLLELCLKRNLSD